MSSTVPAWKAELQRRKREKEKASNEADNKIPWKNDFNEPVNVIIISAKDRDPEKVEDKSSTLKDVDVTFRKSSSDSVNGVLEEHVTSVKNNPFLKFDQLISSQQDGPSSPRPPFLRRGSGPLTSSFDDHDADGPEPVSNLKSRSKSVDNLHFKFQNHIDEDEPSNNIVKEKSQGKGIIASLRAKFGKAASVDEFMAIVRRPRSKSQTSYDVQKTEISSKKDSDEIAVASSPSVSKTKEKDEVKEKDEKNQSDAKSSVTSTTSYSETKKVEGTSPSMQDRTQSSLTDKGGQKEQNSVSGVIPGQHDSRVGSRPQLPPKRFAKKKPSGLSASDLISLNKDEQVESHSVESNVERPLEVNKENETDSTAGQPLEVDRNKTDKVLVGEDETDFVGKIPSLAIVKKQEEKSLVIPADKKSQELVDDTKPQTVTENGNGDIKRTVIDSKVVLNGDKVGDNIEKPTVSTVPTKPALLPKKHEPEKVSPIIQSQKADQTENQGIKRTVIAEVKGGESSQNDIQQSTNLKVTSKETSKINLAPDRKKEENVKANKPSPPAPSQTPADETGVGNTSPFAVKLRKVDKSNTSNVRIVKSSKGAIANVKVQKRTVQTVLQQQVNGEIPVTFIDDVFVPEVETPPKKNVNIKKVEFEVIGYNSPSKLPSMLKTNKKEKAKKLHLRFDDANVQTYEYPSLAVAREEYIAEHGDDEPEDEIVKLSENGEEDDEEDIDEETKKKTMNNNTSIFSEGLQNITKSDNTDLSAYLGRGPHKKEPAKKPVTRTPPLSSVSSAPAPEPELVVTPLDNGDGFSMGNSSALLF